MEADFGAGAAPFPQTGEPDDDGSPVTERQRMPDWLSRLAHARLGSSTPQARLPIDGATRDLLALPRTDVVVMTYDDIEARDRLLIGLRDASPGMGITWVCAPGRVPGFLRANERRRRQRAVVWTESAAQEVGQHGIERLVSELLTCGLAPQDLLVIEVLDPWLHGVPEDQGMESVVNAALESVDQLRDIHNGPLLALMPSHRRGVGLLPLLAARQLPWLAAWHASNDAARLDLYRWGGATSEAAAANGIRFELADGSDGEHSWQVQGEVGADPSALEAPDRDHVIVAAEAIEEDEPLPEGWQRCAGQAELLAACGRAIAPTVVLAFEQFDQMPDLARLVYCLRTEHPRLMRIVVRETQSALRRNGELLVRRLGANAVMRRNLGIADLTRLVDGLRTDRYPDKPAVDPAALLKRLAPDAVRGYLPPVAFCDAVGAMVERTSDTPLEHVLVHMPLLSNVGHVDALLACAPRRNGDVVTADESGLYVFLFACPVEDAMEALNAIFTIPCSELARHMLIDPDLRSQRTVLADLRSRQARSPSDFTTVLRDRKSAAGAGRPVRATVLPTQDNKPAPIHSVQAYFLELREGS